MGDSLRKIGPYRILEPLGAGGMGVVYRAEHCETGHPTALKTVRVPKESLLQSIRREIHALARLNHPGIVPIVDEGIEDGVPWYAMELLGGITLSQYAARKRSALKPKPVTRSQHASSWWTESLSTAVRGRQSAEPGGSPSTSSAPASPESTASSERERLEPQYLQDILVTVRRLCSALSFLHGEGIVHRDLKPANILIRSSDELPVLMDFGLATQSGAERSREALEVEQGAAGTIHYMAPEQSQGKLVDARADLYALGCILYELVADRLPFTGATAVAVLYQHLYAEPAGPSQWVDGVPQELDALILRLLAKRPHERLGYADDVATQLAQLASDSVTADPWPRGRAYLYRPRFAGRMEVLKEMRQRLERIEQGATTLVLVGGESGAGKTRLMLELGREAAERRLRVLTGECSPERLSEGARIGGEPLQALKKPLQAIADRCREGGRDETERLLGQRGKVLAVYEPALAALPGQEVYPTPAELPAEAARVRLLTYLAETFDAFARDTSVVLLLDDLQWADELTLDFMDVLRLSQRKGLLVVGAYRTEEAAVLSPLLESSQTVRIRLGRLDESAVASIVGDMLAMSPSPATFVRFLHHHSEGNPFFVAEYLRTAVAEGLLYRDEAGHWQIEEESEEKATRETFETLALPTSLRELVRHRLEGLSARARHLVAAAAVAGRETPSVLVWRMAQLKMSEIFDATAEALNRQVLEETAEGRLRFVHDKLREVAYQSLALHERSALHHAAARGLKALFPAESDEHLAQTGYHWEQAGDALRARRDYLAAARRIAKRYFPEQTERLYRAYLALVEVPTPESVAARNELGRDVYTLRGQFREAEREHRTALAEARALSDAACEGMSLQALATVYRTTGRMNEAERCCQEALALLRTIGDRSGEAIALNDLAAVRWHLGHLEEARSLYLQALELHRAIGDRRGEGIVLTNLAGIHLDRGSLDEAEQLYHQAFSLHRELGNRRSEGLTLVNLAIIAELEGRIAEAQSLYEQALAIQREIGNRSSEAVTLGSLAVVYSKLGQVDEARRLHDQALAIHRQVGNRPYEGVTLTELAVLSGEQGLLDEARTLFDEALAIHREVRSPAYEGLTLLARATLERRSAGDMNVARRLVLEAQKLLESVNAQIDVLQCLCEGGFLELACGRGHAARALLEQARTIAIATSSRPESTSGQALLRLSRAVKTFEAGVHERLFCGELVEDLPQGLQRWLREMGKLPQERSHHPEN